LKNDMKGPHVFRRILLWGSLFFVVPGTPAAAQAPAGPPEDPAKSQVFIYEMALQSAVNLGGQRLAQAALKVIPQVTLSPGENPIVRGVKLSGYGFFFDVQVPDINRQQIILWDMLMESGPRLVRRPTPEGYPQAVAAGPAGERASATSAPVAGDPMTETPPAFNPTNAYTSFVREALIDALLDSSGVLSLQPAERLTVVASEIGQTNTNPLYRSRKLVITISGTDLLDFRQGRITREQAKERILEERF
jgi:hypothetical protein